LRNRCHGFFQLASKPIQQGVDLSRLKHGIIHLQHRRPCRHQSRIVFDQQLNLFQRELIDVPQRRVAGCRFHAGHQARLSSKLIIWRRATASTFAGILSHRSAPRKTGQRSEAVL